MNDRHSLVLINDDGMDLARAVSDVRPRAVEVRLERFVVHVLAELRVVRHKVFVTPCVNGIGRADGKDFFKV